MIFEFEKEVLKFVIHGKFFKAFSFYHAIKNDNNKIILELDNYN